ncbi:MULTISPECIES: L,D-transpeptidase [Streptomyces]|uniref:L,D-transpeptidase n=1 Tax=Streptomyces TaxID=1883 RepID=UPI001E54C5AE|nr:MULTISPECIES: Ig-like domain-containing protein [Streptomyces]UFQ19050.1 Ig-like domain-containing protein [Streptomyces huasconensis]WCL88669.1 Ig-like domain-containing protein [Streptomyces sp. JCM 35825]
MSPQSSSSRRRPLRTRHAATAGVAVLAAALSACSGGGDAADGKAAAAEKPKISVNLTGRQAKAGEPVTVKLADGKLKQVTVADAKGAQLPGKVSANGTTWTSRRVAAPGTAYRVEAVSEQGGSAKASFETAAPQQVNKVTLAPGKHTTVGIAQPLSITFDHPVRNKAEVEKQLKVTTSNGTTGSWGWIKNYDGKDRVDWRPKEYWKSGTKVKLDARLNGIDSGGDDWFVRDYATNFTVGKSQVVKVNLDSKTTTLVRDGKTVRSLPMSAGTPGGEKASWGGTSVLMSKEGTINMRSETVGLSGSDSYNKMVPYSMRLTWSGMYAHAAPWNVAYFGNTNRSSGCVGMSTGDAGWLYREAQVGDPFEVTGSGSKGTPDPGNGYGEWNLSWSQWQAKSALS